jgi:uncharacterized protein (TIGR03083 family)
MEPWTAWIRAESDRFAELVDGADLNAPVPPCPEWVLRDLVQHLGQVQRFWAANLRAADASAPWVGKIRPPADEDLVGWLRESTDELLSALTGTDRAAPCWTWWGEPLTAEAVGRHQVQEVAVHRWDAETTVGQAAAIDPTAAADGVAEFIETVLAAGGGALTGTVTLIASDTGGRWDIGGGSGPSARVEASSSDLVLLLYKRLAVNDAARVRGERALVDALLGAARTG